MKINSITEMINQIQESKTGFMTFPNYGVVFGKLRKQEYDILLGECLNIKNGKSIQEDFRNKLAGNLGHEYNFIHMKEVLTPTINNLAEEYERQFDFIKSCQFNTKNNPIVINSLWVNFMKKHEFNPLHNHTGIFSFVIWMKIPYQLEDELKVFPETNEKGTSCFYFAYNNSIGEITTFPIPVDQQYEGVVCLFPSKMFHFVNPFFTSDGDRISISGNLFFETSGK